VAYYYVWMYWLPKRGNYAIRSTIAVVDDGSGATAHRIVKVPNAELAEWDATHDEHGRLLDQGRHGVTIEEQLGEKSTSPSESISKV
jgi:hypothetical protein